MQDNHFVEPSGKLIESVSDASGIGLVLGTHKGETTVSVYLLDQLIREFTMTAAGGLKFAEAFKRAAYHDK